MASNSATVAADLTLDRRKRGLRAMGGQRRRELLSLLALSVIFGLLAILYLSNMLTWSRGPDFGWSITSEQGQITLVSVSGPAQRAGLRIGDRIVGVNGQRIDNLGDLQLRLVRDDSGKNIYQIERDGATTTVTVPIEPLGFSGGFLRFGLTWVLGILFFLLGAMVFYMKPNYGPARTFMLTMFTSGLYITFSFTSMLSPAWLNNVLISATAFMPALILHLAHTFPADVPWLRTARKTLVQAPYVFSLFLLVIMRSQAAAFTDVSLLWKTVALAYLCFSLLSFMAAVLYTYIRPSSPSARVRAKTICVGAALAFGIPVSDIISTIFFDYALINNPVYNLPFYLLFPVAIGYSIVMHNLFDVDTYIKRAVGYVAISVFAVMAYAGLQTSITTLVLVPLFGASAQQAFTLLFALGVVILFNPVYQRVHAAIDRIFYRTKIDYKAIVTEVSNALASLLNMEQVIEKILQTVRNKMFIDAAGLILLNPGKNTCQPLFFSDDAAMVQDHSANVCLLPGDPLLMLMAEERKLITVNDIVEHDEYSDIREACLQRFAELKASMVLPLMYDEKVTGALAVGSKKTGRFYSREDVDLLTTLASQGAVAIEIARMAGALVEQERVQHELELAREIQSNMLPKPMGGTFPVTGINVSATEVSGDFYDFFTDQQGRVWFCLGDVSGKGVNAALLMSKTSSLFHCVAKVHDSPAEVLEIINNEIRENVTHGMFVTMVAGFYDPAQDEICLANAGHQPPLVRTPAGQYSELEADAPPLGILKDLSIPELRFRLDGQAVYLYTDGLSEALDDTDTMLDVKGVQGLIDQYSRMRPADRMTALVGKVVEFSMRHGGKLFDDITVLVIERQE